MVKESIKINFSDFWDQCGFAFNKENNYFTNLLSEKYNVEISEKPDLLFYSFFGVEHGKYDCHKIFFTGENIRPNFKECDYAFSFDHIDKNPRNYRLPLYAWYGDMGELTKPKNIDEIVSKKTNFCSFIVSNKFCKKRIRLFEALSKYKRVDSGGKIMNNIGGRVNDKKDLLRTYKFNIAFENCSYPGYTTEKIFEPMLENCIPIYWGNPLVKEDFNTKSFINANEFKSEREIVERIIEIDKNEALYREYLSQPFFNNNEVNPYVKKENVLNQLDFIIKDSKTKVPVAKIYPQPKKDELRWLKRKVKRLSDEIKFILPIDQTFQYAR